MTEKTKESIAEKSYYFLQFRTLNEKSITSLYVVVFKRTVKRVKQEFLFCVNNFADTKCHFSLDKTDNDFFKYP